MNQDDLRSVFLSNVLAKQGCLSLEIKRFIARIADVLNGNSLPHEVLNSGAKYLVLFLKVTVEEVNF